MHGGLPFFSGDLFCGDLILPERAGEVRRSYISRQTEQSTEIVDDLWIHNDSIVDELSDDFRVKTFRSTA
jgi:hypothetical protein